MGFFSGLTANGLLGAVGRIASAGGGPFAPPTPASGAGGQDLLARLSTAMDPERLAVAQALLAGDYGAVSRMTEPLRRRRLAARAQASQEGQSKSALGAAFDNSAVGDDEHLSGSLDDRAIAGPASEWSPTAFQSHTLPWPDSPVFRGRSGPSEQGEEVGEGIVGLARGLAAQAKPPFPPEDPAIGRRIFEEKLRRGGGLNGYGYLSPDDDVNLLTRAAYSEFSRESNWPDLHAGIWAILNRVRPAGGYGRHRNELGPTLEEVLTRQRPNGVQQFPFMPRGGINAPGGSAAWQRSANPEQMNPQERKAWELTLQAVKDVLSGAYPDPTAGASFYYNKNFAPPDRPPGWWATLRRSPYRSPNNENFFGQASEEPERPLRLDKPSPYWDRRAAR